MISLLLYPTLAISNQDGSRNEWSKLHQQAWEAIDVNDVKKFQEIFQKINNPYALHKKYKDTLLSHSITKGASKIAIWMLDRGIDPNDKSKQLPLNNTVSRSDIYGDEILPVIERLLKNGADVNAKGLWGKTPLHQAKMANYKIIKLLLEKGADPNIQDKKGQTPLNLFAGHIGEVRTIQLLIDHGANASIKDANGDTPLHKMIGHWLGEDSVKVAELLVGSGANPNEKNIDGKTALDLLNTRENPDMFHELKQKLEKITK